MNILLAFDSFKDALPASAVCQSLQRGLAQTFPEATYEVVPLADGGEGTLDVLHATVPSEWISCPVADPLGRPITARYLWLTGTQTAIVELAQASGLERLTLSERNCLYTSTGGTGQLMADALNRGYTDLILTVGGSATNDAGLGIAAALGYAILDAAGQPVSPTGENLSTVHTLVPPTWLTEKSPVRLRILTDVTNPFCGPAGAAHVFGEQKGADSATRHYLDEGMEHLATVFEQTLGKNIRQVPGAGAAGGVAGGMAALFDASIIPATNYLFAVLNMRDKLRQADLLITGEGRVDAQSWQGKLVSGLLALAREENVPTILVCGTLQDTRQVLAQPGVLYATSISPGPMSLETALAQTGQLLEEQGLRLGSLLSCVKMTR
ncbi:glycerate kinase [Spirosoma spitsbergense]|uniref:glycerate kinase n=1 Tax=Spirosoma spitsbergense TaxID=431554 RepID=UPI00037D0CB2|nr:glycerate kinase [Spirosoma spitsbergense]